MSWFKQNILKRFKEKEPIKEEVSIKIKTIWGFLLYCNRSFNPNKMKEIIKLSNEFIKDEGYFEINKNLEIEFKSYE